MCRNSRSKAELDSQTDSTIRQIDQQTKIRQTKTTNDRKRQIRESDKHRQTEIERVSKMKGKIDSAKQKGSRRCLGNHELDEIE